MTQHQLIFLEGVVGSGKTTTVKYLIDFLRKNGHQVSFFLEGTVPISVYEDTDSNFEPKIKKHPLSQNKEWLSHDENEIHDIARDIILCRETRAKNLSQCIETDHPIIFDGGLFHRDVDMLFMMNMDRQMIMDHVLALATHLQALAPMVIDLSQKNLAQSLAQTHRERTKKGIWITGPNQGPKDNGETRWLLGSPYALKHNLSSFDGYVRLYEKLSEFKVECLNQLPLKTLSVHVDTHDWSECYSEIEANL